MSVEAVDRALQEWEERLRRVDESLLALEGEPTYEMLAPRAAPRAPLEGETKQRVAPALDALTDLFEHRGRLTEVLERAKELRASMSGMAFWGSDEKEREIQALLYGPSIELPPDLTPPRPEDAARPWSPRSEGRSGAAPRGHGGCLREGEGRHPGRAAGVDGGRAGSRFPGGAGARSTHPGHARSTSSQPWPTSLRRSNGSWIKCASASPAILLVPQGMSAAPSHRGWRP